VDATTGPGRLGEPTEHRDEVFTHDMEQAGTRPDAVVRRVRMLRVRELVGQRVQPVRPKAGGAQQIHEALSNIGAPDAQPSTLELLTFICTCSHATPTIRSSEDPSTHDSRP
jgi:hypothetical protein